MTNEEAIEILRTKMDGSVDKSFEWAKAIRLAIHSLNTKDSLEKKNEFLADKFDDLSALKSRVNILESQMSQLIVQTSEPKRKFIRIITTYLPDDYICYKEYKGKPYYSIEYQENGETIEGYGTYNPDILSRFLRDYFFNER